jgi:hypothetical protein
MASTALVRVTGKVLATNIRKGMTRGEDPRPYKIVSVNILVADENVTVVQMPRENDFGELETLSAGYPNKDDSVDYLAEVSIYGRDVQTRVLKDFPALVDADGVLV